MPLQAKQASPSDRYGDPAYENVSDPMGSDAVLPATAFLSRAFQNAEDAAIWTRSLSGVGFAGDIPNAGDILPFTVGDHGIHVERGPDGLLIGRFNKAQHGGCRAVPLQCQTGAKTKCSFTACGYSRDRQPIVAADPDRDRVLDQYLGLRPERLLPVAVDVWGPLVSACLDPTSPHRAWPEWSAVAGARAIREGDLAPRCPATQWMEWNANWKHVVPAFVPASTEALDEEAESHAAVASPAGVTTTVMFPNVIVMAKDDAACVAVLQPTALDRTLCRVRTYGAGSVEDWSGLLREARVRAETWQDGSRGKGPEATNLCAASLGANPIGRWFGTRVERAVAVLRGADATTPLYRTDDKGGW